MKSLDINLTSETAVEHMRGLDMKIFRGKRIAMMGDSTLYYPTKWLYPMIKKFNDEEDVDNYENMTLGKASAFVHDRAVKFGVAPIDTGAPPKPIKTLDGTVSGYNFIFTNSSYKYEIKIIIQLTFPFQWIEWMGVAGPTPAPVLEGKISAMFSQAGRMKPHVIIANMG